MWVLSFVSILTIRTRIVSLGPGQRQNLEFFCFGFLLCFLGTGDQDQRCGKSREDAVIYDTKVLSFPFWGKYSLIDLYMTIRLHPFPQLVVTYFMSGFREWDLSTCINVRRNGSHKSLAHKQRRQQADVMVFWICFRSERYLYTSSPAPAMLYNAL